MAKDTKERILAAALDMFSQNGYTRLLLRKAIMMRSDLKSACTHTIILLRQIGICRGYGYGLERPGEKPGSGFLMIQS